MVLTRITRQAYHFHGVTVIVPPQFNNIDLVAVDMGSLIPNTIPDVIIDLTLIRLVANIALLVREDYEKGIVTPVSSFDPPIELRVGYNCLDVIKSGCEISNLKLAFWDGRGWIIISDEKHEYLILPPSTGQVAEAKILHWAPDPPLAWIT